VDTPTPITHIGLCAGYGGIELGLHRVIRNLRTVALCEIEAFACANLVAKMEAGLMDAAPIWTDLKSFPWAEFRDRVDILTGGYPCQPFSAAGKRLGTDDPRHLWPFIADGIRLLRPRLCFFENVEGHISLGLREVVGELESIGYKSSWGIFSASEVGAPHQRKRVFILAVSSSLGGAAGLSRSLAWDERVAGVADNGGCEGCGELADSTIGRCDRQHARSRSDVGQWATPQDIRPEATHAGGCGGTQAWPSRPGEQQHGWEPPRVVANDNRPHARHGEQRPERELRDLSGGGGEDMGNAQSVRVEGRQHDDTSSNRSGGSPQQLSGASGRSSECRQTQPALGGDADGPAGGLDYAELRLSCDNRTDELRLLGNGVVPATAERAFRVLIEELFTMEEQNNGR